ncbi:RNA polymerase sigma factor [Candidatus Dojkabacteria bacterium]|uniref:RNA polymerase sigma factor n=1 Tax=Candidatus Dojkabacteria bacterium TaxID=2099670 RepID=A0A955L8S9_9BACT|nr:RNA polymerase sigma factor [Candidatus Dojkabacteria bacterium]
MDVKREKLLIEQAKESLEAFDELYEYYFPKIYGYIFNRTRNRQLTEDVTSETFLKAMKKIDSFVDKGYPFGPWLYRIAHNTLIDAFRKASYDRIPDSFDSTSEYSTDGDILENEEQELIVQAVQQLPEQYQEILSLRYFQELENEEIAVILKTSSKNVALKMHRALKALKELLSNDYYKSRIGTIE